MSTVVNYIFGNMSRMGADECVHTQESVLNKNHIGHMLYNPYENNCEGALDLATSQPEMMVKGTHQIGPQGCNISESNDLYKGQLTNPRLKISLHERPYLTVPYLGKGNVDVGLENSIRLGDTLKEKKSVCKLGENQYLDLGSYPLDKELKKLNHDSSSKIESDAVNGWVRGGLPSREIYKNKKYECRG